MLMGCYFFRLTELQLHVQICLELNMLCHFCWGTELPLRLRNTTACANCQLAVEFRGASFYNELIPNDGRQHAVCSNCTRQNTACLLVTGEPFCYILSTLGEIATSVRKNELFCSAL